MSEKLEKLLEAIKLDKKHFSLFSMGELLIKIKEKEKQALVIIYNDHVLPVKVYFELKNNLDDYFNGWDVSLKIEAKIIDYTLLPDYYEQTVKKLTRKKPVLEIFADSLVLNEEKQEFYLEVVNNNQKVIATSILHDINGHGSMYGFDTKIAVLVNEEKGKELKNSIASSKAEAVIKEEPKPAVKKVTRSNSDIILGRIIKSEPMNIKSIIGEDNNVTIIGEIFGVDFFESNKNDFKIITLKVTDNTDSIYVKLFTRSKDEYLRLTDELKIGRTFLFRGPIRDDQYSRELVLNATDVVVTKALNEKIVDAAEEKRIELHVHTKMSQMDGLIDPKQLIQHAISLGHEAVAVTDHDGTQSFPDIYNTVKRHNSSLKENEKPFRAIYGSELTMIDDAIDIITNEVDQDIATSVYVVFDIETTGFNAGGSDEIIEVGAVKILNGEIIDKFESLIKPNQQISPLITSLTNITNEMVQGKRPEKEVITEFRDWVSDLPIVAHNAKFDISFLSIVYEKHNLGKLNNPVIDTLKLSQTLDNNYARHNLKTVADRYKVPFDSGEHHRALYDSEKLALVFTKMIDKLKTNSIHNLKDLNNLVPKDEIHKYGTHHHVNILVKNKNGLKNLYKIISLANTKYLFKYPRILRSEIQNLRKDLLIGSGCAEGEVFKAALTSSDEELANVISFYDYVEVQPKEVYNHLIQTGSIASDEELTDAIKKVIRVAKEAGVIIIGTGDVHHLTREEKIFRQIIVNQKVPGGGLHPLSRNSIREIPSSHFRTTKEMLNDFSFLGEQLAKEIVITNPKELVKDIPVIEVITETNGVPFAPKIKDSDVEAKRIVYENVEKMYGKNPHPIVKERIEQELQGIISSGYDVIYLISHLLVKKSNEDGYLVGSRGSVGSSLVATMMNITEVNPLPPHYVCSECHHTEFADEDGVSYSKVYSSGYDLPDKVCPKCDKLMMKEGQDIPFATFLGFDADKVPDIDLNFSGDYQPIAHEYTKTLFGEDYVFRAGTIGTVADKTAYGFVKGYFEDKGLIHPRGAEIERLAKGCTGVKRTTGQHPGGIVVVPKEMEIFDFTPYQYPANDIKSLWRTTHFDYHSLEDNLLKLDILGHDDPTILKMLGDLSGIDVTKTPIDDEKLYSLLSSPKELGISEDDILCPTGTLGLPELGTRFVIAMLSETKPKTFGELVKISGLSHGTDVWAGNASELIKNNVVEFKDVIGCRDDIMVNLIQYGMEPLDAFKIMEFVRKGKASREPKPWAEMVKKMKAANVPDWYIESCFKIKYMFPKAHASAYVLNAVRIAWFKLYHPLWYYAAYFSIRATDFDIETMINGYDDIKATVIELNLKGYEITNTETAKLDSLKIALEASARGVKFANVDVHNSLAKDFKVLDDNTLLPALNTIEGLGENAAKTIVSEREKRPFISIEDLEKRGRVNKTVIQKMRLMGVLNDLPESSQTTLF